MGLHLVCCDHIVVDFGHGMLSRGARDLICSNAKFLAVNTQANAGNRGYHTISKYARTDYVSKAENEIRIEARNQHGQLEPIVEQMAERLGGRLAVTRGRRGCVCCNGDGLITVPALAGQVTDRIGAGDAFLSITALCVAQGAPMDIVGLIGNAVGAQAVAWVGNRQAVERVPLCKYVETLMK